MVVVYERDPKRETIRSQARRCTHILEKAVAFIVEQNHTFAGSEHQICEAIVVIVACGTRRSPGLGIKSRFGGYILELPVAAVVIERHAALGAVFREKDVNTTVVIVV